MSAKPFPIITSPSPATTSPSPAPATTQHNATFTTSGITTDSTVSHGDLNTAASIGAIVGITLVAISLVFLVIVLYYFTFYRHSRFDQCKILRRRTKSSGANYSQHNHLEPDKTNTSDPVPRTDQKFFSIV